MNARALRLWRHHIRRALKRVYEAIVSTFFLRPIIWFLMLYDAYWAPRLRRKAELQNIKHLPRGDRPYLLTPLPRKRQRALTNPLPSIEINRGLSNSVGYSPRKARQRTEKQRSCSFLERLPLELRELVYVEVLADGGQKVAYINRRKGWLAVWSCSRGGHCCKAQAIKCSKGWLEYRTMIRRFDNDVLHGADVPWTIPGVLLTCRAV